MVVDGGIGVLWVAAAAAAVQKRSQWRVAVPLHVATWTS